MITSFNTYDDSEIREELGQVRDRIMSISGDVATMREELDVKADVRDLLQLRDRVEELELFSQPNVTIVGEPTIVSGQVSNFSVENYLKFPYLVHLHDKSFEIKFCLNSGADVENQQNIVDSEFGLAIAVRNGHFVLAMSSDGESWNMGEHVGTHAVEPNTNYHVKLVFDKSAYSLLMGDTMDDSGDVEYVEDIHVTDTRTLSAKEIIIGKDEANQHIFDGSINLNHCYLILDGKEVWKGISTNLETDLSNLSSAGAERIKDLAKEVELIWYGTQEDYDALEDKTLYKLYIIQE